MRNKYIICMIIIIMALTACEKSDNNNNNSKSDKDNSVIKSTESKNNKPDEKGYEYGEDNETAKNSLYKSDTIINKDNIENKYNYSGRKYSYQASNISNDDQDSTVESLNDELAKYVDKDTGEYIINKMDNETDDEAKDRVIKQAESIREQIQNTESKQDNAKSNEEYCKDIEDCIINGVYYNGVILLSGKTSDDNFDKNHSVTAKYTIRQLQSNLECIEYCDSAINNNLNFTNDELDNWNKLKDKLIKFRSDLAKINTIEEYNKADLNYMSDISEAMQTLNISLEYHGQA